MKVVYNSNGRREENSINGQKFPKKPDTEKSKIGSGFPIPFSFWKHPKRIKSGVSGKRRKSVGKTWWERDGNEDF